MNPSIHLTGWTAGDARSAGLPDCCLIVATYKRPVELTRLLIRLMEIENERAGSVPGEVTVVDGSPDQATEDAVLALPVDRFPYFFKFVRSKPGLTRQRNVGIDASQGEFVFFLDDDSLPEPDYFLVKRRIFLEDGAKRIGAIGGCVTNDLDQPVTMRWKIRFFLGIVPRIEPMRYLHCGTSNPRGMLKPFRGTREVDLMPGCAFTFRREVLERERFSNFFEGYSQGEDMEMSLRVGRHWKVVCSGDARALHEPAPSGRPASFYKGRMEVRNRIFIWRRHSRVHATIIDRLRLAADFFLLVLADAGAFIRRPWKTGPFQHGIGVLWGMAECVLRAPDFDEAKHRISYRIDFHSLAPASYSHAGSRTA